MTVGQQLKYGGIRLAIAVIGGLCVAGASAYADSYEREREQARRELAPYFNKQVGVRAALVRTSGPEWTERFFNTKLFGCPAEPVAPAEPTKEIFFRTSGAGPWAGAVDGINTVITTPDGVRGNGFAVPSKSTARLPGTIRNPEFEFSFDATIDLKRALVDAAAAAFDRCYAGLPPGSYTYEELMARCPYRQVTRAQQRQSCVVSLRGIVGEPLADGSGFVGSINESTVCDFVGYGRSGDTTTSFTACYYNEYEGVATISTDFVPPTAEALQARATKRRMMKMCGRDKRGRSMRPAQMRTCVMREMARSTAAR